MKLFLQKYILHIAFIQTIVATCGSLYFSEIAHFIPCTLCWYQRICMYPLVVILGIGLQERNERIFKYVLPFSIVGWGIALYHILIQYSIIPETVNVCSAIGSCTQRYTGLYGFITIPLMSFVAFTVVNICLGIYLLLRKKSFD